MKKEKYSSQPERRKKFIKDNLHGCHEMHMLEIGALNRATFVEDEVSIKFADYWSTGELKKKYSHRTHGVVNVDYVLACENSYRSIGENVFDLIIANHVVEHVPDIIGWLRELSFIAKPGGFCFLAVPDKRYTFDILRPESTLGRLIEDYENKLSAPRFSSIFDHQFLYRDVKAVDVWRNQLIVSNLEPRMSVEDALEKTRRLQRGYASVHNSVFTYSSFLGIFNALYELGFISWRIAASNDVMFKGNEFMVLLTNADQF